MVQIIFGTGTSAPGCLPGSFRKQTVTPVIGYRFKTKFLRVADLKFFYCSPEFCAKFFSSRLGICGPRYNKVAISIEIGFGRLTAAVFSLTGWYI